MGDDGMELADFGRRGDRWILTYAIDLPVNRWDAWIAITSRDGLGQWFPATIVGEWTTGRTLRFGFAGDPDGEPMTGRVVDVEPGSLLAFTWAGDSLRMTLTQYDAGTRLVFAASLDSQGRGAREGAGWHVCLAALRASVGGYVEDADRDWKRLFGRYAAKFGPDAATILPPAT
ncbi:MAG TPA: SRPBCC domain-containing protein [Arthrobacter sp.]|nr:SRPBCC domain-containing protein [Arthrobacter sp.]